MSVKLLMMENEKVKVVNSPKYNSIFHKDNGEFYRWGETLEDNPLYAPMPEILDLEISAGKCMGKCPECYKCNGAVEESHNMTFQEFRNVFHKVAKTVYVITYKDKETTKEILNPLLYPSCFTKQDFIDEITRRSLFNSEIESIKIYNEGLLTQIAFGICDIGTNPDFFKMLAYCREFDVVPNYTCHALDMTKDYAEQTSKYCGAVAISVYNKDKSYNAVKMLAEAGMKQINFHTIAHDKSYDKILSIIDDLTTDDRIKGKVKAVVLLKYKPKGNGVGKFNHLTDEQYRSIISYAEEKGVGIGFDSCSAHAYLRLIKNDEDYKQKSICAEPCESACFSSYINHKGEFYACSFCENEGMWKNGIDVLKAGNFEKDVWNADKTKQFREMLLKNERKCPMFRLD